MNKTAPYRRRQYCRSIGTLPRNPVRQTFQITLNRFIVPLGKKFFLPRQKQSDITQDNNKNEDKKEA